MCLISSTVTDSRASSPLKGDDSGIVIVTDSKFHAPINYSTCYATMPPLIRHFPPLAVATVARACRVTLPRKNASLSLWNKARASLSPRGTCAFLSRGPPPQAVLQGYLAHKKHSPPMTLRQAYDPTAGQNKPMYQRTRMVTTGVPRS